MRAGALSLAAALAACAPDPPQPHLKDIEAKVFKLNCTTSSCHSAEGHQGGLDLTPGHAFAELVNVAGENQGAIDRGLLRVKPGAPDESLLILKLREKVDVELGVRMPEFDDALDTATVDAIAEWIRNGAKDD